MNKEPVSFGLIPEIHMVFRVVDHQMNVKAKVGLDFGKLLMVGNGLTGHEDTVHDIQMDTVNMRLPHPYHLLKLLGRIGYYRGDDLIHSFFLCDSWRS